ncbi:MAG: hypothetical protein HY814_06880 [Candidatus Riflebacteria bacterium]|nr:hypothetical protein [Candidatus Riflebacteria bacterium]
MTASSLPSVINDAAKVRRAWQLKRKLAKLGRALAAGLAVLAACVMFQQRELTTAAGSSAREFLRAGSLSTWGGGRERFFSSWLKEAEPPDRFDRDIRLLQNKLGKLNSFQLTSSSASLLGTGCQLSYQMSFERGHANGYFEMTQEDGRWVVDTFAFWSPNWKAL